MIRGIVYLNKKYVDFSDLFCVYDECRCVVYFFFFFWFFFVFFFFFFAIYYEYYCSFYWGCRITTTGTLLCDKQ